MDVFKKLALAAPDGAYYVPGTLAWEGGAKEEERT